MIVRTRAGTSTIKGYTVYMTGSGMNVEGGVCGWKKIECPEFTTAHNCRVPGKPSDWRLHSGQPELDSILQHQILSTDAGTTFEYIMKWPLQRFRKSKGCEQFVEGVTQMGFKIFARPGKRVMSSASTATRAKLPYMFTELLNPTITRLSSG